MARQILAETVPGESRVRVLLLSRGRSGPSPMTILLPVQGIFKNASMFFSTATRPT